jgi:hypothetical protein
VFGDRLADHLPSRVLPISTQVPRDIQTLVDEEYSQVKELLSPGRRRRAEARGRVRTLLLLQAHAVTDVHVSERDVDHVADAIKNGQSRHEVLPDLATLGTNITGDGINVTVHFSRIDGAPVRYAADDESAVAIRVVDLEKKYHMSKTKLATKLGLTTPKAAALRRHLDIDSDDSCHHQWRQGKTVIDGYSDNAYQRMKQALGSPGFDIDEVWRTHSCSWRKAV